MIKKRIKGFTLIELLIVMAVLGVLAVIVLVAVNPAEQLRRARDSGRISAINQLGRAMAAYYTATQAYPTAATPDWGDELVASQDIATFPSSVSDTDPACGTIPYNGYCYSTSTDSIGNPQAIVFARLVSQQQTNRCDDPVNEIPYSVFSTQDGRGGVVCANIEPTCCGNQDFRP